MMTKAAASETGDSFLLTPGPLTTSRTVKEVMVHDWGSRDATFLKVNSEVLTRLPEVVNGGADYVTVPMQGSGSRASTSLLILRKVASREPQSWTITSLTRWPVVRGPGVRSSGSPVSETAGFIGI